MKKLLMASLLMGLSVSVGCGYKPITKTFNAVKKVHNTTRQVYRATKSVAELVNPLEYIYVSVPTGDLVRGEPEPDAIWVYDRASGRLVGVIPGDQDPLLAEGKN